MIQDVEVVSPRAVLLVDAYEYGCEAKYVQFCNKNRMHQYEQKYLAQ